MCQSFSSLEVIFSSKNVFCGKKKRGGGEVVCVYSPHFVTQDFNIPSQCTFSVSFLLCIIIRGLLNDVLSKYNKLLKIDLLT